MLATMLLYVSAIVLVFVLYISKMWKFYYASFKMKGPTGWPLIGNALEFIGTGEGKSYGFNVSVTDQTRF